MGARLLVWMALALVCVAGGARADVAARYTRAEISASAPGAYAPASPILPPGAEPTAWRSVALPGAAPHWPSGGADAVATTWWRIHPAMTPSARALYLYLPSWGVPGRIAVYADRRLIWATPWNHNWVESSRIVWAKLAAPGAPAPREILIRMDSPMVYSRVLSQFWIGDEPGIGQKYRTWNFFLLAMPKIFMAIFLGVGAIALAIWLIFRRDNLYLLLFFMSVAFSVNMFDAVSDDGIFNVSIVHVIFYLIDALCIYIGIFSYYTFCRIVIGLGNNNINKLMLFLFLIIIYFMIIISTVVIFFHDHLNYRSYIFFVDIIYDIAVILYAAILIFLVIGLYLKRSFEGLVAVFCFAFGFISSVHDIVYSDRISNGDDVFIFPFGVMAFIVSVIFISTRRYLATVRDLERVNLRLDARVRQREAELTVRHARLRQAEGARALAAERGRLLTEMHDGLGGNLIKTLSAMERGVADIDLARVLRDCIDEMKLTIDSLEPLRGDLLLLLAALRHRLEPRLEAAGVALIWDVGEVPPLAWLDPQSALQILRIVREAFTAVVARGGARQARLATSATADRVIVVVEDDGPGGDPPDLAPRAATLGAAARWTSSPAGTRFELSLPI